MGTSTTEIYCDTRFSAKVMKSARDAFVKKLDATESLYIRAEIHWQSRQVAFEKNVDGEAEFFQKYRESEENSSTMEYALISWMNSITGDMALTIRYNRPSDKKSTTHVTIKMPSHADITDVLEVFSNAEDSSKELFPERKQSKPRVFIGHGQSPIWRDLKDHISDQHHYEVVAYESGARAGHTIRDIVEDIANETDIAFLIHTAEDKSEDGSVRSRSNVIHETGLFQGKLGFSRAIVILEEGCEEFSNIAGIQQIRFSKGNIREVFGDVIATLKREFPLSD